MSFGVVWLTIVYFPIAHMVWAGNGIFFSMGALDFAGGTVVHINAGVSALVACLVLGKRIGYPRGPLPPTARPRTATGPGRLGVAGSAFIPDWAPEPNAIPPLAWLTHFSPTPPRDLPRGVPHWITDKITRPGGFLW